MKKRNRYFLLFNLFMFILLIIPSLTLAAYSGEGQQPLVLKIGSEIPGNDIVSQAPIRFAERMKQRTNDKIQIQYFSDSQLGKWQQMLESVKTGSIAGMYSPAGGSKELYVIQLPFVFRDLDHARKVMDGELREEWTKKHLEKTGIYIFGWQFTGWHSIYTTKVSVRTPADMKGMKFRVPQDRNFIETFNAIGANPTPIPFGELYLALRQGLVEGMAMPLDPVIAAKFYEVVKFGTLTHHMISAFLMHLNGQVWKALTSETQKVWMETWKEVSAELTKELIEKEQKNKSLLESNGMKFSEPDMDAFREATKDVWQKLISAPEEIEAYQKIKAVR